MRLGLVTDIHSHPAELARALDLFRQRGVDGVVTIGDTIDAFAGSGGAAEVAALLLEANVIGVWGNHDFGLCRDVTDKTRSRLPAACFTFMARMTPRLVVADCHFSHREAYVDPFDVAQLWDLSEQRLDIGERAARCFATVPQRWQFVGHYHRWWAATPSGPLAWQGTEPLVLDPAQRYFVVVGAVFVGWCGLLDLERRVLEPLWCGVEPSSPDDRGQVLSPLA